jgi:RNA polymerase sigma-70 factor (ECF subfamily)
VGAGTTVGNEQLAALVEAVAARQDRAAFARLFSYLMPRLKGFAMRRGLDGHVAEELAQETMVTVWRKAGMFDPTKATVSTWVFTIIRNKHIDQFRRQGYPLVDLDEAAHVASADRPADEALFFSRAGESLQQAMSGLPVEQMEILQKAFFEEKSHSVIAEELGLPLGTVKSRIRLALARLRGSLAGAQE